MYFKKISCYDLVPCIATVYKNKKTNGLYYNLRLGTTGEETWEYVLLFDKRYFSPEAPIDRLELNKDNYIIKPVKERDKEGKLLPKKDLKNNIIYVVGEDESSFHKKDLILIWELPNRNFTNIEYSIKGPHNILAEAKTGKERNNKVFTSPIVLVELLGDCKLSWEGTQDSGDALCQNINFKYETGQISIDTIKSKGE